MNRIAYVLYSGQQKITQKKKEYTVVNLSHRILDMEFPERLSAIRKEKGLTQQKLAKLVGLHVAQVRRYEGGTSQPTLEVIRKLAVALSVSADTLLFDKDERGPDNDLRLQFEAISRFEPEEKQIVKTVLDSLILKHEAKRWSAGT
jgi:transcriptional regulator with XRE-family HTH domain